MNSNNAHVDDFITVSIKVRGLPDKFTVTSSLFPHLPGIAAELVLYSEHGCGTEQQAGRSDVEAWTRALFPHMYDRTAAHDKPSCALKPAQGPVHWQQDAFL
jgi:hypothetical protein